jgi:hypothetical protein
MRCHLWAEIVFGLEQVGLAAAALFIDAGLKRAKARLEPACGVIAAL